MSLFRAQRVNLSSRGLAKVLGDLEARLLEILWHEGPLSVREVVVAMRRHGKSLSFNAVMTILNRLVTKGVLKKQKGRDGNREIFLYAPVSDRGAFLKQMCQQVFDRVFRDEHLFSPAGFVEAIDGLPKKEREEIIQLFRQRRR